MFEHPDYLYFLALLPFAAAILWAYWRWRTAAILRLGRPDRIEKSLSAFSPRRFWLKNALWLMAFALLVLAFANPRKGVKMQQTTQESSDVFIAIDISQSMLARDVKPSRLDLTKAFARKLVEALEGERIGLIFFAGNAFLQMPLSTDYAFTVQSIQNASPDLVSAQGTAIPAALELAQQSFDVESTAGRAVVLITDGENHDEDAVDKAEAVFKEGIVVLPVGAGTPEGGFIPTDGLGQSQFKRDETGELVRTRLNENLLRELALAGGGKACNLSQGNAALALVTTQVGGLAKRRLEIRAAANAESRFQWFLLPALLLLALEYLLASKKGGALLLLLPFLLPQNGHAQPSPHKDLRKGDRFYNQQEYTAAEDAYRNAGTKNPNDPKAAYNTGNALYRQGRYDDAVQFFDKAQKTTQNSGEKADALHNLGNSYLKQEKFKEASEAYENSLRLRPGDPESKMNLQYVKQKLKEQQQQNQQNKDQQNKDQQQKNDQQSQNQQQQPQNKPGPSDQQQEQEQQQPGRISKAEAKRLLETAVSNEDRRTAKKYREGQQKSARREPQKDW